MGASGSAAHTTRNCPRCGGRMMLRLKEYECERCGHFMPLGVEEDANTGGSMQRDVRSIHTAPQPPPSDRLAVGFDLDTSNLRLAAEKRIFMVVLALTQLAGGVVLVIPQMPQQQQQQTFGITWPQMVGSVLVALLVAAIILYIDWYAAKKVIAVLLALDVLVFLYEAFQFFSGTQPLIGVKLLVDAAMQVWMGLMLVRDVRLNA